MKGKVIALVIVGVLVLGLLIFGGTGIGSYNELVKKNEKMKSMWSQVENTMQRRADLIPNLVNTVKGITKQEQDVFVKLAEARSKLLSPQSSPTDKVEANRQIDGMLVQVLSLQENYPELKSSESFKNLQYELAGSENRIAIARKDYIDAVQDYNTYRGQFPTVLVASLTGFQRADAYFRADEGAKQVPKVDFSK